MSTQHILIVDDDETFRLIAREALQKKGFFVEEAVDGARALESARRTVPLLIVLDLMMPGIDGVSLCREIRETPGLAKVPVLVVTALNDPKVLEDARRFGATDHLAKPVEAALLVEKIEKLVSPSFRGAF